MARSGRRSRGRGGPEIRGTLGTLLRTTLAQAGVVKDALQRGAREGRARLDDVRRERQRDHALAELGQALLDAVRAGEAPDELYDLPEVMAALDELDRLDRDLGEAGAPGGRDREPDWVASPTRDRFDRRAPGDRDDRDDRDRRDRRGARDPEPGERGQPRERGSRGGDGTVSSSSWRPPPPSGPSRVWRPPRDVERDPGHEPGARFAEPRRGGISFGNDDDDDGDLADYMHPDDVPDRSAGDDPDGDGVVDGDGAGDGDTADTRET